MSNQFHKLSKHYLKKADLKYRKNLGQYFTPRDIREHLLSQLPRIDSPKILDPANGTGEFLLSARDYFNAPELHGWEIDKKLVELSRKIIPSAKILCVDTLQRDYTEKYDFVIGNPPYFEFKPEMEIKRKFRDVIKGRANIFSMFIKMG
ncbi:MAG: N-6 DNA methylase, partial [Candidatus Zixiibacteriota bacterium]